MAKLLEEIAHDAGFIRSHTLQPRWYKVLKVFILLGVLVGYYLLFGGRKTAVFLAVFMFLSLLLHLLYRAKTERWTRSWRDFVVVEENGERKTERIGRFYYTAIAVNAILALAISQIVL